MYYAGTKYVVTPVKGLLQVPCEHYAGTKYVVTPVKGPLQVPCNIKYIGTPVKGPLEGTKYTNLH